MRRSKPDTQTFLLDNNVFIAAIKHPTRQTDTLKLILHIISEPRIGLVGNVFLVEEMVKYAELLESVTAATILQALLAKIEIIDVSESHVRVCLNYIDTPDYSDVVHVATCLQVCCILVSNDQHFNRIRDEGIVGVWSVKKAIEILLQG